MIQENIDAGKNILIYFQNSVRNVFFESFVSGMIDKGYKIFVLTKCDKGILHVKMEELGAITAFYNPKGCRLVRGLMHIRFLIKYCRKNKIDICYSHLQLANLIALMAQYFIRTKVLPCRHHVDESMIVGNKMALRIDKWVNRLAKKIIVVSNASKKHMISFENVREDKIIVIPLGYDFNLYNKPDLQKVSAIRQVMSCHLLLIAISRMSKDKRHLVALNVLYKLVKEGFDVKMLILDKGPEEENLKNFVQEKALVDRVLFTGFLHNTMDYAAAADMLVHPSVIESSNQVVRELANLEKTCIVCAGIGDFDEYIVHRENGFFVSKDNTQEEMFAIVKEYYYKKDNLMQMGRRLKNSVVSKFQIKDVVEKYLEAAHQ